MVSLTVNPRVIGRVRVAHFDGVAGLKILWLWKR